MAKVKSVIGAPIGRVEGPEKVSGRATYAADVHLPGTLWGKLLRSPHTHARITHIDASRAREVEGVRAVITGKDIVGTFMGKFIRDIPALCWDKVRFVGDRVAAVAAETPDAAEAALERIEVQYEELPAVFDPLEAMQPNAPRLHDDVAGYDGAPKDLLVADVPNGLTRLTWGKGNIEEGFREADLILEHTFRIPIRHQGYIEPQTGMVAIDDDGRIQVWISTKSPYATRRQLAKALDVPESRICINAVDVGGDFGGKGATLEEPLTCLLAMKAKRPVKHVFTANEEFTAAAPRHAGSLRFKTGVMRDGTIVAHEVDALFDSGAYGGVRPGPQLAGASHGGGCYRAESVRLRVKRVY
ncbi:MAG: xanthine dehydrogenase family protein molybdopterin-binding subunit, partial [Candidatus Binatia bacterium]